MHSLILMVKEVDMNLQYSNKLARAKVLASWNGLMVTALAKASRVLGEARYAEVRAHVFCNT